MKFYPNKNLPAFITHILSKSAPEILINKFGDLCTSFRFQPQKSERQAFLFFCNSLFQFFFFFSLRWEAESIYKTGTFLEFQQWLLGKSLHPWFFSQRKKALFNIFYAKLHWSTTTIRFQTLMWKHGGAMLIINTCPNYLKTTRPSSTKLIGEL